MQETNNTGDTNMYSVISYTISDILVESSILHISYYMQNIKRGCIWLNKKIIQEFFI